jgi:hypothetical protein
MMRAKCLALSCLLSFLIAAIAVVGAPKTAHAQTGVSIGDIVQTGVNGQNVVGEVTAANGLTVDLNLGQNNNSRLVSLEYVKVLQKAGTGGKASCAVGDVVQVPYIANTVLTGWP